MKNIARFYNCFAPFYGLPAYLLLKHKRKLISIINTLPQGNLLEIGIGSGSTLPLYKRHIITGIDLSARMLAMAQKRKTIVPVKLFLANGEDSNISGNSFDYIVINHVLAVTQQPDSMLQEAFRLLKPNGMLFILNHFTPDNILGSIDRAFTPVAKLFQFRSHFSINQLEHFELFRTKQDIALGKFGYYKIIILTK